MTVLRPPTAEPRAAPRPARAVYYPESDGQPMAETDWHWLEIAEITQMLRDRYRDMPDAYVASNNLLYYVEGDPHKSVSPDVYVVFGVPKRTRRVYKLWEEGAAPAVVFEVTSRKTRREDFGKKRDLYARLGVDEYFLCDPELDYLRPPLQGLELDCGAATYRPMTADADGRLTSARLGLKLWLVGGQVQLADAATGERLLRSAEVRERERAAEAENARLRAEIERLRRERGG
jgi:Uma2 family endonuclease